MHMKTENLKKNQRNDCFWHSSDMNEVQWIKKSWFYSLRNFFWNMTKIYELIRDRICGKFPNMMFFEDWKQFPKNSDNIDLELFYENVQIEVFEIFNDGFMVLIFVWFFIWMLNVVPFSQNPCIWNLGIVSDQSDRLESTNKHHHLVGRTLLHVDRLPDNSFIILCTNN